MDQNIPIEQVPPDAFKEIQNLKLEVEWLADRKDILLRITTPETSSQEENLAVIKGWSEIIATISSGRLLIMTDQVVSQMKGEDEDTQNLLAQMKLVNLMAKTLKPENRPYHPAKVWKH